MPPTPAAAPALTTDSICNNHGTNQKKSQTMMDNDKKTKKATPPEGRVAQGFFHLFFAQLA
jgi:hypothetical protein